MFLLLLLNGIIILEIIRNKKNEKILFTLGILVVFGFSAFRVYSGLDDEAYIELFKKLSISKGFIINSFQEPLFQLLIKLLTIIPFEKSVFFLTSIISAIFFYKVNVRIIGYSLLPLIFYVSHKFLHNDLNQIRQGVVSLGFLYLLFQYKSVQWFKGVLLVGIHILAILYYPIQILVKKINLRSNIQILLLLLIGWFLGKIFNILVEFNIFNNVKLIYYLNDSRFNNSISLLNNFVFLKSVILFTTCILILRSLYKESIPFKILVNTYFLGILAMITFQNIEILSGRVSSLFFTAEPFLIYFLYQNIKLNSLRILFIPIILLAFAQLVYNLFLTQNTPIIF